MIIQRFAKLGDLLSRVLWGAGSPSDEKVATLNRAPVNTTEEWRYLEALTAPDVTHLRFALDAAPKETVTAVMRVTADRVAERDAVTTPDERASDEETLRLATVVFAGAIELDVDGDDLLDYALYHNNNRIRGLAAEAICRKHPHNEDELSRSEHLEVRGIVASRSRNRELLTRLAQDSDARVREVAISRQQECERSD